jgi:outer membrane protein
VCFLKPGNPTYLLTLLLFSSFFLGCAGTHLILGDGKIEKPLEQVTGVTTSDVQAASQKSEMGFWDVYALAVDRTERMADKVEDINQAEAQEQQAVASILPQISLNEAKNWQSNGYIFGAPNSFFTPLGNTIYLSGTETLFSGLDQVAALQGAGALKTQNQHLFKQESRNLLLSLARSFYSILQLENSLQSKEEIEKLNEQILKQEQQWRAVGRSRDSDVLTTEAQLAQLKGDKELIHSQLSIARDNLVILSGLDTNQPLKSEEPQPTPPPFALKDAVTKVDSRPDVLAAKAAVDLADAELLQAHGQHLPSVSLQGKYYLEQEGGSPTADWNVQLVASLPLFEGGAILAKEKMAASKKHQAALQYSLARRQALQDIRGAYSALNTTLRELDAYSKALEAAQKDYEAVARDRRLALNTNLDLLQSLTQLQTAKNNYNQAHYQSLINSLWLGIATGELPRTTK